LSELKFCKLHTINYKLMPSVCNVYMITFVRQIFTYCLIELKLQYSYSYQILFARQKIFILVLMDRKKESNEIGFGETA